MSHGSTLSHTLISALTFLTLSMPWSMGGGGVTTYTGRRETSPADEPEARPYMMAVQPRSLAQPAENPVNMEHWIPKQTHESKISYAEDFVFCFCALREVSNSL